MESSSVWKGIALGAIGSSISEIVVMPMDVAKTRLQMQGADGTSQYRGLMHCFRRVVSAEGMAALYKGIEPALARQMVYGGLRYGLYVPIRNAIGVSPDTPKDEIPLMSKFVAGGGAGGIASVIANPTDLVKVRLQVDGMKAAGPNHKPQYQGVVDCMQQIYRNEGVLGFWKGSLPNLTRAVVLAAFELTAYDEIKAQLMRTCLIKEGEVSGVFLTALGSGFIASCVSNPIDVIKSRVMGQPVDAHGKGKLYSGMVDCTLKTLRKEGAMALTKGFLPCWGRQGPRGVIVFVTMEQLNKWFP